MKLLGIDFTSAPKRKSPIAVATGELEKGRLRITSVRGLTNFKQFEAELNTPGPWIAGIDFPFGQPAKLVRALNWPTSWTEYVNKVASMGREEFQSKIEQYCAPRPDRDKHHKRLTDRWAKATSPMNLVNPPVGKMFFEGAHRILHSGASIVPCAPNEDNRIILEAYPKLAAKALAPEELAGRKSYKGKPPDEEKLSEHRQARAVIVSALTGKSCRETYGCNVELRQAERERLIEDAGADFLDAVLCALQAAWAHSQQPNYGVPRLCNSHEGWIVDPSQTLKGTSTMRFDNPLDRITTDPSICHGQPCIRGLRYPVDTILDLLSSGMTTEDILVDYDDLEPEDLSAVLAFAARLSRVKSMQALAT